MRAGVSTVGQDELGLETRLMLRAAQLYYRLHLTQDQVGERLGVSRFKVGRLLDRALREDWARKHHPKWLEEEQAADRD